MAKRKPHKKKPKKDDKRAAKLFITFLLCFLMIGSIAGFLAGSGSNHQSAAYNGQRFTSEGNVWVTEVDGKELYFHAHPTQVDFYPVDEGAMELLENAGSLRVSFDPEGDYLDAVDLARFSLSQSLSQLGKTVTQGISTPSQAYALEVASCEDATETEPVIAFTTSTTNTSAITLNGNCVSIESSTHLDPILLKDRVVAEIAGIIE